MDPCNNTSVGVIVRGSAGTVLDGRILLINRANPPYGWAPPAGHVDSTDATWAHAAARELREEVGLACNSADLQPMWAGRQDNCCCREGGDHHDWAVYAIDLADTRIVGDFSWMETRGAMWARPEDLALLAATTAEHLAADASPEMWRMHPGLAPVWVDMLTESGWIPRKEPA